MAHIPPRAVYERKWWLLRNGRVLYVAGIVLGFIVCVSMIPLVVYVPIPLVFVSLIVSLFGGVIMILYGSAYTNLSTILEELPHCEVVDFNPVRFTVEVRDQTREYMILYYSGASLYGYWQVIKHVWSNWDIPPEHYQVWTPFEGLGPSYKDRYDFMNYVRPSGFSKLFSGVIKSKQREMIFDGDLEIAVLHLHEKAKRILSLRFVGLANERGKTILLALLTRQADNVQVKQVVDLFKEIVYEVKHGRSY